jgi:hypothetical protein
VLHRCVHLFDELADGVLVLLRRFCEEGGHGGASRLLEVVTWCTGVAMEGDNGSVSAAVRFVQVMAVCRLDRRILFFEFLIVGSVRARKRKGVLDEVMFEKNKDKIRVATTRPIENGFLVLIRAEYIPT